MAYNKADIELLAGLNINSSEAEILRAIKILQKRIRNNESTKIKVDTTIDNKAIRSAVEKLQKILKSKELKIETKTSIESITKEANAMLEVVSAARKASEEKLDFAEANKKVRKSADDTADAIIKERNAMEDLENLDYVLGNINMSGRHGQSVFQQFGDTLRNAFYAYTAANLLQDALHEIIDAGEEGVETVKELNDALTSLRMATGQSYESVKGLLGAYNDLGQELGAITVDVSESADEWLRQGHSISDTNELIKDSLMLSKISHLESAESTKYLTSAMQGYRVAAEDVIRIVDKLSAVDLESATDAGGLAEAMSRTAEGARIAGIEMDRLLGMIATVGEVTQKSMSSIGEAFKSILARMRSLKDNKLSVIGDDGEIEDLSNVEIVLGSLGIKLRDSNLEFRNFQEVLEDVGESWDKYTSVQKAAIAKAFSGTRQQENFLVMMENWDKVIEYTEVASNSAGTAEEKFGYYLESLEAKTNSLVASLENLASNTISDELYASVLDTTKAVVDMTAETGILKGALAGLGTAGAIYTFQHLATYLHNATQEFSNLGEAMQITKNASGTITDIQRLIDLTGGLSQSQTKLLLSTNKLTDAQKIAILMNQGLTKAEAQQQIQTWGIATAQKGATVATISFGTALKGLWATLLANPLILISSAVTIGVTAFNKYKEAQEEAMRATKEAAEEANELGDEISTLATKYIKLSEAVKSDENAKEELLSVQENILDALELEASSIDDLIEKYGSLSNAIKQVSIDKLRESQIDLIAGIDVAKEELMTASDRGFWGNKNIINATGTESVKAFKELEKAGVITKSSYGTAGGAFVLVGDTTTVDGALENYHRLEKALEALRDSDKFTAEQLADNELYQGLYKRYKEIKDEVKAYENAVGNLNENIIQQTTLIALQGQEIPKTKDAFNEFRKEIIRSTNSNGDFIGNEGAINATLDAYLSTLPEFKQFYLELEELQDDASKDEPVVKTGYLSDAQKNAIKEYKSTLEQIEKIKQSSGAYSDLLTTFPEYDWSDYLSGAEALDTALRKIASGSFADVKEQFEGVSGSAQVIKELRASLWESFELYDFGWSENLEHYNELVGILERVKKNKAFSRNEITDILSEYDFYGDIQQVGNGFVIDENAIKSLINQYVEAHNESLQKFRNALEKSGIDPNGLLSGSTYKEFYSTAKEEKYKEIDWLITSISNLQEKVDDANRKLKNTNGLEIQKEVIKELSAELSNLKKAYVFASDEYNTRYKNALYSLNEYGYDPQDIQKKIEAGLLFDMDKFPSEVAEIINDAIDAWNGKRDADNKVIELEYEIQDNIEQLPDLITSDFDRKLAEFESRANMIESKLANAEARGLMATQEYYKALKEIESDKIGLKKDELKSLQTIFDEGQLEEGSDAWYDLRENIEEVKLEILEAENAVVDFENKIRQIDWDLFNFGRKEEQKLIDEADFMIDLLDSAELFSDAGEMTAEGLATMGLHAQNYNAYLEQSIAYAEELADIQKKISDGTYSDTDKAVIERRNELLELQQESILASENERDAMISLVEEGINLQKDAFSELIDSYTTALENAKSLYNYQKKNAQQTRRIADIQKQLSSLQGDNSDEAKAKKQQLQKELKTEQESLQEQQYDRYIEEQKSILASISEDYNAALDSYLENIAEVVTDSVDVVNKNATDIGNVLAKAASDAGYGTIDKLGSVWLDEDKVLQDGFEGVSKSVADGKGVLSEIKAENDRLIAEQNEALTTELHKLIEQDNIANQTANDIKGNTDKINSGINTANALLEDIADNIGKKEETVSRTNGTASSVTSSSGVNFKYQKNLYTGKLNTEYSIVDRLKSYNFDPSYDSLKSYYAQMGFTDKYSGTAEQNIAMLEWMKKNADKIKGYASGGHNLKKQFAWTQEDGTEYIIRPSDGAILTPLAKGDSVLTSEATKNLWNMANNPIDLIKDNLSVSVPNIPVINGNGTVDNNIQMTINLPGVTNYQEFVTRLQSDKKFEKMIVDVTSSALTGSSSLAKYKHKF